MVAERKRTYALIISSIPKVTEYFTALLKGCQFNSIISADGADEAKRILLERPIDFVVINTPLPDDFGIDLALDIKATYPCGVLLFVKNEIFEQVAYKVEDYGIFTLPRPNTKQIIVQAVKLIMTGHNKMVELEDKVIRLESKVKEMHLVNKAKWLLIENCNLSESEAHRQIEKKAMDNCIKRSEVAQDIISMYSD